MQNTSNFNLLENEVFPVNSKDHKTMMLAPDGMLVISKRVADTNEFQQAVEKGGLLSTKFKVTPEKLKSITVEQGEAKMTLNYRKMLELGAPGELEFSSEVVLEEVLDYIQHKWYFQRSEKPLSAFKAILPYLIGLAATLYCTYFVLQTIIQGGAYRAPIFMVFLVKIGEKIGLFPTLLLALAIMVLVIRALWKAFKNPPIEMKLAPIS